MDFHINFYLLKYDIKIFTVITECFGVTLNFEPKTSASLPPLISGQSLRALG